MGDKVRPDRRAIRNSAKSLGVPDELIEEALSGPDEVVEIVEALAKLMAMSCGPNPNPPIGLTTLENGLKVSTVLTTDCGYETAIMDAKRVLPVERYATEEYAEIGHAQWVERMKDNPKTVQEIAWMAICPETGGEYELRYPKEAQEMNETEKRGRRDES